MFLCLCFLVTFLTDFWFDPFHTFPNALTRAKHPLFVTGPEKFQTARETDENSQRSKFSAFFGLSARLLEQAPTSPQKGQNFDFYFLFAGSAKIGGNFVKCIFGAATACNSGSNSLIDPNLEMKPFGRVLPLLRGTKPCPRSSSRKKALLYLQKETLSKPRSRTTTSPKHIPAPAHTLTSPHALPLHTGSLSIALALSLHAHTSVGSLSGGLFLSMFSCVCPYHTNSLRTVRSFISTAAAVMTSSHAHTPHLFEAH